jgi:hypothetical protein
MPNDDHIAQLLKGVAAWNVWRDEIHPSRRSLAGARGLLKMTLRVVRLLHPPP